MIRDAIKYLKYNLDSWYIHGSESMRMKLVLEALIINDNRDLLKRQIHS